MTFHLRLEQTAAADASPAGEGENPKVLGVGQNQLLLDSGSPKKKVLDEFGGPRS